jgi:two-component system response regulator FixJ
MQDMEAKEKLPIPTATVIVVDDDAAVRNSLKFSLEIEGFSVRAYSDGAELLQAGELLPCACFVIDQKLPGMTGLDVIAKLRDRAIRVPAILITSQPDAALARRAGKAGVPIVEKPLLGNALVESIRAVVDRAAP